MESISFQVDTRLARILSENYRSSEKALKELVDNAWDADSGEVLIRLPEPAANQPVVISDDGSGMTRQEIEREYLYIARDRRSRRGEITPKKKRKVKGRKGIGKFAGLVIANTMTLETWARGKKSEFTISKSDFDSAEDIEKLPIELVESKCEPDRSGTRITLSDLKQHLNFPVPDKLRQILLQEYGRENDFDLFINKKKLAIDDLQGKYTEKEAILPKVGKANLKFTVADKKSGVREPGISIRVDGKVIGKPSFFGLDEADDFPANLLKKLYGEIEVDGLSDHTTADWGAIFENSELLDEVKSYVQPIVRKKVTEVYGREMSAAQARLKRKINDRLSQLPEYKRQFADKAIRSILDKYFGEPPEKTESIVSVLLDALERTDYRALLDSIHHASHSDIAKIAEVLSEFGLAEIAIIAEQAQSRLKFIDRLEELCQNSETSEAQIHEALENALWIFGIEYSIFSSNKTLKRQVEDYLQKKYKGERANKRPDLMLNANYANQYLLIEFKKPSHSLKYSDYQQVTGYRNDFIPFTNSDIKVLLLGGKRGRDLQLTKNHEPNTEIMIFPEIISNSRIQLNWLLEQLGGETHA